LLLGTIFKNKLILSFPNHTAYIGTNEQSRKINVRLVPISVIRKNRLLASSVLGTSRVGLYSGTDPEGKDEEFKYLSPDKYLQFFQRSLIIVTLR